LSAASLAVFAGPAHAALTASSSAAAVSATVTINGNTTVLPAQVVATGSAPPAYNQVTRLPSLSKSFTFTGGLTLNATGKAVASSVMSGGPGTAGISARGSSMIGSFNATVTSPLGTFVTVTASKLTSTTRFMQTSKSSSGTSTVSVGSLTVNAPSFGINNVTFAGTPTANQVLFHNSDNSFVIYLNQQTVGMSGGKPSSINASIVDVHASNLKVPGGTITGDVLIGPTFAN
jgi:hypothetical protein